MLRRNRTTHDSRRVPFSLSDDTRPSVSNDSRPVELTQVPKVIEYLMKKGYTRTEQTLRAESANVDKDGRPIIDRAQGYGSDKYRRAFDLLSGWIDQNLDVYKVSLRCLSALLF